MAIGLVRRVVDQVVGRAIADAAEDQPVGRGELVPREVPDVVVQGLVAAGRKGLAVAAFQDEAARAGVVDVAADDAVAGAAGDVDAQEPHVADFARLDAIVASAADLDAVAQAGFDDESAKDDVRGVLQQHQRRVERREHDPRGRRVRRRPEVEPARRAVDVELARPVQFLQQVQRPVPPRRRVALLDAVDGRRGQGDLVFLAVDRLDPDDLLVPVEAPVALEPDAGVDVPSLGPVALVLEDARAVRVVADAGDGAGVDDLGDGRPAVVGPARQRQTLVVEEQLGRGGRAAEAGREGCRVP